MKNALTRLLGRLDPREMFNMYQEWHAFVEGLCEVICPWPARYEPNDELLNDLKAEHHYYACGRALGVIAWLAIAAVIKVTLF